MKHKQRSKQQNNLSSSIISSLPESVRNKAIEHLYQGKSLTGKDGIFGYNCTFPRFGSISI